MPARLGRHGRPTPGPPSEPCERWLTLSKLTALGFCYGFLGLVMFAATFSYSFLML